ncbi:gliding motility protein [Streptomyces sp. NPDC102278]|uniref:gliding motility protein n=1 Tax=Streptomyces sp. NPDC102278 TaxID=3366152 RepID=UPI003819FA63
MTDEVVSEDLTVSSEEATSETTGVEAPAAAAAEIPQQKSAEVSLDSEAGEGART